MSELSFSQKFKRVIIGLGLIIGLFLAVLWGSAYYLSPQSSLQPADAIVVISGGQTTSRADEGIRLYQSGMAPVIIFSGAALDNGPSNALEMKRQALADGVPEVDILTDESAKTTYENATHSKAIIDKNHLKSIILVTSPYHQRRASMTFSAVFGSNYKIYNHSSFDNRWSKFAWWASPFGVYITGSEIAKVIFITVNKSYQ